MWGRTWSGDERERTTMYTGTGDGQCGIRRTGSTAAGIIGLKQDPQTKALALADFYGPSNAEFLVKRDLDMQVTPAIFTYKGRELMVDAGKECRIYLMDTKSIGGDDHRTPPLYRSPQICNEDFNSASQESGDRWRVGEDAQGTRWVLTPIWGPPHSAFKAPVDYGEVNDGAIVAFKLQDKGGKLTLEPAWMSQTRANRAEPPVIANGIVFGYGSGEDTNAVVSGCRARRYSGGAAS